MQAWKIVISISKVTPEARAHDGYEWIYVLSGHMRLVLGDHDWILGPGEIAEFDTTTPQWFGSSGDEPTEVLSIFAPIIAANSAGAARQYVLALHELEYSRR